MAGGVTDEILKDTKEALDKILALDVPYRAQSWDVGQWQQIRLLRDAMVMILRSIERLAIQNDMIISGQIGPGSPKPGTSRSKPGVP